MEASVAYTQALQSTFESGRGKFWYGSKKCEGRGAKTTPQEKTAGGYSHPRHPSLSTAPVYVAAYRPHRIGWKDTQQKKQWKYCKPQNSTGATYEEPKKLEGLTTPRSTQNLQYVFFKEMHIKQMSFQRGLGE